jgi:GNAT superfamily N-acetyltransferase
LQDLFVADDVRKLGLGRALIEAVEQVARATGASRVYWLTHESNAVARALYDKLSESHGFIQYRKVF